MSKRSVAFIKPEEPSFLKKLKAEAGYQEGPTIDTKREELENFEEKDFEENVDEQPTVVVLKAGDLSAEEVAAEKDRLEREEASAPADLSKPIIFKIPLKEESNDTNHTKSTTTKPKRKSKEASNKRLLSFDNEEDDDV